MPILSCGKGKKVENKSEWYCDSQYKGKLLGINEYCKMWTFFRLIVYKWYQIVLEPLNLHHK